jgi:hypothetical protein
MKIKNASKSVDGGRAAIQSADIPAKSNSPQLLSRRQLASRWSCCVHTIARLKHLKPVRFNKRFLRYKIEDVEAIEAAAAGEKGVES